MNIRPLRSMVALKQVDKENKSASGIVLMGGSSDTPEFGVIAIGPKVTSVKVDDRVFIELGKASVIENSVLMIDEDNIVAVLD